MGKGKKLALDEIKAGDEIELRIRTRVLEVDPDDDSMRLENEREGWWVWPSEFGDRMTFREVEKPLIPEGAAALSYIGLNELMFFLVKNELGVWADTDGDTYRSTAELVSTIKQFGKPETVTIYAKVER